MHDKVLSIHDGQMSTFFAIYTTVAYIETAYLRTAILRHHIYESIRSGIKPARSSPSAVVVHAAAVSPAGPSVNSRLSLVSSCSLHCLEQHVCKGALTSGPLWGSACVYHFLVGSA